MKLFPAYKPKSRITLPVFPWNKNSHAQNVAQFATIRKVKPKDLNSRTSVCGARPKRRLNLCWQPEKKREDGKR